MFLSYFWVLKDFEGLETGVVVLGGMQARVEGIWRRAHWRRALREKGRAEEHMADKL